MADKQLYRRSMEEVYDDIGVPDSQERVQAIRQGLDGTPGYNASKDWPRIGKRPIIPNGADEEIAGQIGMFVKTRKI